MMTKKHNKLITIILPVLLLVSFTVFYFVKQNKTIIIAVPEYNQHPDYPTGCESASLYMLLKFYDVNVTMEQIVEELPKGPLPYEKDGITYGANPEKEFVGNPKDYNSYGVFNEPIKKTAEKFKSGAKAKTNATFKDIDEILSKGNPVVAWFTTNTDAGIVYRNEWLDYETQEKVRWPSYEHAVVITGYSKDNLYYNDPNTGSACGMSKKYFEKAFSQLGGRIVYYDE